MRPHLSGSSPFTIHAFRFAIYDSPFTRHDLPFTIHHSRFPIHDSPFSLEDTPNLIWAKPHAMLSHQLEVLISVK